MPDELQAEIEELMSRYPDHHSAALPALAAAQRLHGWCSPEAIDQVAAVMRVTPAYLSSVATFYDMLNTEPVGRQYVWVCTSVACMPKNAKAVYDAIKEAGGDLDDVHIREFECLGACDMAPMASVNGRYIGPLQPGDAEQIVEALKRGEQPLPGRGLATMAEETRVLLENIDEPGLATIEVYERLGGYSRLRKGLIEHAARRSCSTSSRRSGLRGRGGAGFSMGKKASFIPKGSMDKYLCCNADESEPGTFKDRLLMQKNPHLLIEGIIIAARAAGASQAFIFIRGEYELQARDPREGASRRRRRRATSASASSARTSRSSCGSTAAQGAYICGEESALLDALEGKRGNPRLKPPFPANQGLYQGPTLINNVETLCNVPLIVEKGADWFKSFGTEKSAGTKLVSVSGNVQRPGNYEIELGIPAREHRLRPGRRAARGPRDQVLVPGRVVGARAAARGTSTCPTTSRTWPRPARCSAPARSS